jgi:hypothetical protein
MDFHGINGGLMDFNGILWGLIETYLRKMRI